MQTRTPSSLKWLVDKRARLVQEIRRTEIEARSIGLELEKRCDALRRDLAALDRVLSLHEIAIDPESIPPINGQRARRALPHSYLTRSIMKCLRLANGSWCSTLEIALFVATTANLDIESRAFSEIRLSTRYRLKNLHAAGRVIRRHEGRRNTENYWSLPPLDRST
jgi:hypothetical protein